MNKKGNVGMGSILMIAVAVIFALVLLTSIASNVELTTRANSGSVVAVNTTVVGVLNTPVELTGQTLVSVQGVVNTSTGGTVAAANYTVGTCVRASNNLKGICYTAIGEGEPSAADTNKISYTYYPDGYVEDSAARSIIGIIVLLVALAIGLLFYKPVSEAVGQI
jgi:hypothetical protein